MKLFRKKIQIEKKYREEARKVIGEKGMDSRAFGKIARPYNIKYKHIFGYIPCPQDYICHGTTEFFAALLQAIETKQDISTFIPKREIDYLSPENVGKRY